MKQIVIHGPACSGKTRFARLLTRLGDSYFINMREKRGSQRVPSFLDRTLRFLVQESTSIMIEDIEPKLVNEVIDYFKEQELTILPVIGKLEKKIIRPPVILIFQQRLNPEDIKPELLKHVTLIEASITIDNDLKLTPYEEDKLP